MSTAADWVCLPDEASGHHYYANLVTGETQWERPAVLDAAAEAPAPPEASEPVAAPAEASAPVAAPAEAKLTRGASTWQPLVDEASGYTYYYNPATNETTWVLPADDEDEDDEEDDAGAAEPEVELVAPVAESDREAAREQQRATKRLKLLEEILTTERAYVQSLGTLKKVYLDPLRMVADTPKGAIFSHADLDGIFVNIDTIALVNAKFLEELELEHANWPRVSYGPIIARAAKQFKGCYARYVNAFDEVDRVWRCAAGSRAGWGTGSRQCQWLRGSQAPHALAQGQGARPRGPARARRGYARGRGGRERGGFGSHRRSVGPPARARPGPRGNKWALYPHYRSDRRNSKSNVPHAHVHGYYASTQMSN